MKPTNDSMEIQDTAKMRHAPTFDSLVGTDSRPPNPEKDHEGRRDPTICVAMGDHAPESCVNCPECGYCFEVLEGDESASEIITRLRSELAALRERMEQFRTTVEGPYDDTTAIRRIARAFRVSRPLNGEEGAHGD